MLNIGLLTPQEVVRATLDYGARHDVPLNSLEGFIRQVMGWREYIRMVYEWRGREERTRNFWGFERPIPESLWKGTTGIDPVDDTIRKVRENVRYCSICFNLSEEALCGVCKSSQRDGGLLCIVEQPRDLIALEQTGVYKGMYHVLLGRIAPLDGIGPDQLTIEALVDRVRTGNFREVVLATNPNVEGDGTAMFISNQLSPYPVQLTRLARGVTSGSVLEFTNKEILSDALSGRQKF
jgi:recombination protein RecR